MVKVAGDLRELFTQDADPQRCPAEYVGFGGLGAFLDDAAQLSTTPLTECRSEIAQFEVRPTRTVEPHLGQPRGQPLSIGRRRTAGPGVHLHQRVEVVADDARRVVHVHQRGRDPLHRPPRQHRHRSRLDLDQRLTRIGNLPSKQGVLAPPVIRMQPPIPPQPVDQPANPLHLRTDHCAIQHHAHRAKGSRTRPHHAQQRLFRK